MSYMFYNCSNLTNLDLSSFDIKNVTDMDCMFYKCSNCSNLTDLEVSFCSCSSSLYKKEVTYMESMFYNCSKLKKKPF